MYSKPTKGDVLTKGDKKDTSKLRKPRIVKRATKKAQKKMGF